MAKDRNRFFDLFGGTQLPGLFPSDGLGSYVDADSGDVVPKSGLGEVRCDRKPPQQIGSIHLAKLLGLRLELEPFDHSH